MKNYTPYESRAALHAAGKRIGFILLLGLLTTGSFAYFTPTITTNPSSITVCRGSTTSFTVVASGTALTYQWQVFSGGVWSDISNNSQYSNATTPILTVTGITAPMSGLQYRCNVSDGVVVSSGAATLTVNGNTAPAVWTNNFSQSICAAGTGTISVNASTATSYQWQVSTDGGVTWTNTVDGATYSGSVSAGGTLNILSGIGLDGFLYHYIATDGGTGCSATSAIDTLHSLAPIITAPTTSTLTICPGSNIINASVSGFAPLTYQWQLGSTNISDNAVYSGTGTTALTINAIGSFTGNKYKLIVTDGHACQSSSGVVTLSVPSVTLNTSPVSTNVCAGTTLPAFTVGFSSTGGTPFRQWQTDNGTTAAGGTIVWTNVGTNSSSYSPGVVTLAQDGFRYRTVLTSGVAIGGCNTVTSSEAILHVGASGTWLGAVDTNWHVTGNWCGGVPVSTTDVLVPNWAPRMPTISATTGAATWQSIKIENTAGLRITGGTYPYNLSPSVYNLLGTVSYIADADQNILPATHGSLTIGGSLNKILTANTDITHNLTLGGSARLITGNNTITMKNGSNNIAGTVAMGAVATSWIVTGNGLTGATNTGLGGLIVEQMGLSQLFPVGPTPTSYNPVVLGNSGTPDNFRVRVNDQPLPGSVFNGSVNRSWLVDEQTPGGSVLSLTPQWVTSEEQLQYIQTSSQIIRSDGTAIVQYTSVLPVSGSGPFITGGGAFSSLTQFSVASYTLLLPVRLTGFGARRAGVFNQIDWQVDAKEQPSLYTLERSADGALFTEIARIAAGDKGAYTYADKDPGNAVTYYRLKMETGDGKNILYSRTVTVTNQLGAVRMELRPSVTGGNETSLFIILPQKTTLSCTLTDAIGRVQLQKLVSLEKGAQSVPLSVAGLAKGIYYLRIAGSDGMIKLLPLVKQ